MRITDPASAIERYLDAYEAPAKPGAFADLAPASWEEYNAACDAIDAEHSYYCADCNDQHLTAEGYARYRALPKPREALQAEAKRRKRIGLAHKHRRFRRWY